MRHTAHVVVRPSPGHGAGGGLGRHATRWPRCVTVSTLDSESSDPSSNLGRTFILFPSQFCQIMIKLTPWRNGSASDSRSEGCVFESRRGLELFSLVIFFEKKMFASNED